MDILDTLASIAADLTAALSAKDRYQRLLGALHRIIPFDAAALLHLEGNLASLGGRSPYPACGSRAFT